ncbi:MAG TPA: YciC family protein [Solirubrobacterales bacterium]|nr:YciC family protein [Solirubrobacterales bacterium]
MERKLSVGDTLGKSFAIYRDQAGVLLPVAFWLFLGIAVLEGLLGDSIALLAVALLTLVVTFLYQGMVVGLVQDLQDGRRDSSVRELVGSVVPVLMPLIGAGLVTAIGIVFGFVLLIVPGLYLLTIWAVTAPVVVVERRGVFEALGRSRQLARGSGWPVFWTVLAAVLIGIVVTVVFALLAAEIADGPLVEIVFYALSSMVTAPIEALIASVLYFRLRGIEDSVPQQPGDGLG